MGVVGNLPFGLNGSDEITDQQPHLSNEFDEDGYSGYWYAIEAYGGDAVFSMCTMLYGDNKNGVTLADGRIIYGLCSRIDLTSGKVRAYRTLRKGD